MTVSPAYADRSTLPACTVTVDVVLPLTSSVSLSIDAHGLLIDAEAVTGTKHGLAGFRSGQLSVAMIVSSHSGGSPPPHNVLVQPSKTTVSGALTGPPPVVVLVTPMLTICSLVLEAKKPSMRKSQNGKPADSNSVVTVTIHVPSSVASSQLSRPDLVLPKSRHSLAHRM